MYPISWVSFAYRLQASCQLAGCTLPTILPNSWVHLAHQPKGILPVRCVCFAGSTTGLRQALLIGFANRLARRMATHNGYKTLSEPPTLAQLHPSTARITADEDGLLPEWVIYHELVSTARVFLSRVSLSGVPIA